MSTPRTLTTLPTEIQEMIFATASSARPTVKDLTILASISVHYRHMMLRVLRRLRKALDTQYNKLIAQREAKYPRTPGRPETEGNNSCVQKHGSVLLLLPIESRWKTVSS
jgi:hypothetical protein